MAHLSSHSQALKPKHKSPKTKPSPGDRRQRVSPVGPWEIYPYVHSSGQLAVVSSHSTCGLLFPPTSFPAQRNIPGSTEGSRNIQKHQQSAKVGTRAQRPLSVDTPSALLRQQFQNPWALATAQTEVTLHWGVLGVAYPIPGPSFRPSGSQGPRGLR